MPLLVTRRLDYLSIGIVIAVMMLAERPAEAFSTPKTSHWIASQKQEQKHKHKHKHLPIVSSSPVSSSLCGPLFLADIPNDDSDNDNYNDNEATDSDTRMNMSTTTRTSDDEKALIRRIFIKCLVAIASIWSAFQFTLICIICFGLGLNLAGYSYHVHRDPISHHLQVDIDTLEHVRTQRQFDAQVQQSMREQYLEELIEQTRSRASEGE